ncbi:MAG: hypothetical protein K2Q10_05935 [Rhodospirillales bacterium]|nr:hypothetical protein [Rhodospirillales bacterium]
MTDDSGSKNSDECKKLLRLAERRIEQFATENTDLSRFCADLMEAQKAEAKQMVELSEQIWALEEALISERDEKGRLLEVLGTLKARVGQMREHALKTLQAAAANASRLELAQNLFDLAATADEDELARLTAEYNTKISRRA